MTRRRIKAFVLLVVEEIDDRPSLPPSPACQVVETSGELVSETVRPLAKVLPFRRQLKAVG